MRPCALGFLERGWTVAGLDLAGDPRLGIEQVDVSDAAAVAAAIDRIRARHGEVDAVVTAAGHYEIVPVSDVTGAQWSRMLRVHLGGALNLCGRSCPG